MPATESTSAIIVLSSWLPIVTAAAWFKINQDEILRNYLKTASRTLSCFIISNSEQGDETLEQIMTFVNSHDLITCHNTEELRCSHPCQCLHTHSCSHENRCYHSQSCRFSNEAYNAEGQFTNHCPYSVEIKSLFSTKHMDEFYKIFMLCGTIFRSLRSI